MQKFRLRPEEIAALNLRGLYSEYGYTFYRMSRFEEYDFYADKKDFLISRGVLTFTDADGKLMALRPDVTLSIIRHIRNTDSLKVQKFFYDEKIYRVPRNSTTFREIPQAGVECIGHLDAEDLREVLELALLSLHTVAKGRRCILDVSHAGLTASLVPEHNRREILQCLAEKNIHGLREMNAPDEVIRLAEIEGRPSEVRGIAGLEVLDSLSDYDNEIRIDFSAVNNLNYYNGIVFRGFIEGVSESVLSGGQYDNLMAMMGHSGVKAAGFAVNLDLAAQISGGDSDA